MQPSDNMFGSSVADTLAYIHMKATRKGTIDAYQTAYDELQGVWLLLIHTFKQCPYWSIAITNLQIELQSYMNDATKRRIAKETLEEIENQVSED